MTRKAGNRDAATGTGTAFNITSAVYRTLIVTELAENIAFEALEVGHRKTCAYLARTCKILYNPAMNVLWRRFDTFSDSIRPFLLCFPRDVWNEVDNKTWTLWPTVVRH